MFRYIDWLFFFIWCCCSLCIFVVVETKHCKGKLSHSRCLRVVFFSVTQDPSICIQFYFEDDNSAGLTKYQLSSPLSDIVVRCYDAIVMIYDDYLMYLQNIYIYRCYYNSFLTIWLRKKIQFGVCVKSIYKKEISGHNWQIVILFDF